MFENMDKLIEEFEALKKTNKTSSHIILGGKSNQILVSTPHSVDQTREGKTKYSEPETALVALYLHHKYNVPCIIKLHNNNDDANWDQKSLYKDDAVNYIKQHNVGFVLDLHQMASFREQNICFGVGEDNSNLLYFKNKLDDFKACFKDIQNVTVNNPFGANGIGTNAKYISTNCKIPAMQLEINSKLISRYYNATKEDTNKVFGAFCKLVEKIKELVNSNEDSYCK